MEEEGSEALRPDDESVSGQAEMQTAQYWLSGLVLGARRPVEEKDMKQTLSHH